MPTTPSAPRRDGERTALEKLCEEGKHQPLDAEIKARDSRRGTAGVLIETPGPACEACRARPDAKFTIDPAHPKGLDRGDDRTEPRLVRDRGRRPC